MFTRGVADTNLDNLRRSLAMLSPGAQALRREDAIPGDLRGWAVEPCEDHPMEIVSLGDAPGYDWNAVVAQPLLEGSHCNVRIIRLSPGQALPPHTHEVSDPMIYAVEGEGTLATDAGTVPFVAGSVAFYGGDEELRVADAGESGLTLLAILAPPFPPRPPS